MKQLADMTPEDKAAMNLVRETMMKKMNKKKEAKEANNTD